MLNGHFKRFIAAENFSFKLIETEQAIKSEIAKIKHYYLESSWILRKKKKKIGFEYRVSQKKWTESKLLYNLQPIRAGGFVGPYNYINITSFYDISFK